MVISFVKQYYGHLSNDPAKTLFRFYKEESAFTHGEGEGGVGHSHNQNPGSSILK